MALTLSELQAQRDALIRARSNGLRSVRDQNGEEVHYRSDSELAAALRSIEARISQHNRVAPTTIVFATSKGLE